MAKVGQSELCSCSALAVIRVLLVEIDRTSEVSRGLDVFSLAYVQESKVLFVTCFALQRVGLLSTYFLSFLLITNIVFYF